MTTYNGVHNILSKEEYVLKKKKKLKNTGQVDLTRNPTQPATRLTRDPIDLTRPFCHV